MDIIGKIAERRIAEAIERGELDNLPGSGRPLRLDDESGIPEDKRAAYRVLKNAGCVPPELEARKEVLAMADLLRTVEDEADRARLARELDFKLMKFNMAAKRPVNLEAAEYEEKIYQKLTRK